MNKFEPYLTYSFLFLIALGFLLVYSLNTSPLFDRHGNDSAMFITIGNMLLEGKIPYVDFFDHKGISLFVIEAIGLSFTSGHKSGIFILQVIFLTITLILAYRSCNIFLSKVNSLTIAVLTVFILVWSLEGGNLTEEYSLPFLYFALLQTFKFIKNENNEITTTSVLVIGLSAGILFWMRPNNMGAIVACMLFIFIVFVKNRDWKNLKNLILFFTLGFAIISLIIVGYFWYIDALEEMIYASFIFNFKYIQASAEEETSIFKLFKTYIAFVAIITGIVFCFFSKKNNKNVLLLAVILLAVSWITTSLGPKYPHYMTLNLPCFTVGMYLILAAAVEVLKKKYVYNILCILTLALFIGKTTWIINDKQNLENIRITSFRAEVDELVSEMDPNNYSSVFAYNTHPAFWPYSGLSPNFKYFTLQENHARHDKQILDKINQMMVKNPPKYVVISGGNMDEIKKKTTNFLFYEILDTNYHSVVENKRFHLFELKDN